MNHAHLRAFHAVAVHRGFTRAARALHVTQPTVSDQVKALEQRYGVALFERRGREVMLTPIGQELLAVVQQQFALESRAEQLLLTAKGLTQGILRVAADAPYHIVPMLGRFHRLHPGIRLALEFGNSRQVLDALFQRRTDVAVLPGIGADNRLFAEPIRRDRLVVFVPREHSWARRRAVDLAELTEEPVVLRESGSTTRSVFEAALAQAGLRLNEVMEIASREGVREAVAAGLGVGIVSATEFGHDRRLQSIALKGGGLEVTEFAACLAERRALRTIGALFDLLKGDAT